MTLERLLGTRVESLKRSPYIYGTSFALDELEILTAGSGVRRMLLKDLGVLSTRARSLKPSFLYDPLREIAVYQEILAERGLGTAYCHGAVVDPVHDRYWLFLEHADGLPLWQIGEMELWQRAAQWLANLHTHCREVSHPRLINCDRQFYETWLRRAQAAMGDGRLVEIASIYDTVVARLLALPVTLIHNEFYSENVLIDTSSEDVRVCAVDWETAARGPGLLDLAALTAGEWSESERNQIISAYNQALPAPYPMAELQSALDCCRLHIAMLWLGFAEPGKASPAFLEEWMEAAVEAAARL